MIDRFADWFAGVLLEKGVITVKATDGNPRLGGFDIDDLVFNYIHEQCVKLFEEDVWPKNNRNQSAIAWECKVQKELLSIEQEVTVSVTDDDIISLARSSKHSFRHGWRRPLRCASAFYPRTDWV